jgi:hypothetical protein
METDVLAITFKPSLWFGGDYNFNLRLNKANRRKQAIIFSKNHSQIIKSENGNFQDFST